MWKHDVYETVLRGVKMLSSTLLCKFYWFSNGYYLELLPCIMFYLVISVLRLNNVHSEQWNLHVMVKLSSSESNHGSIT